MNLPFKVEVEFVEISTSVAIEWRIKRFYDQPVDSS